MLMAGSTSRLFVQIVLAMLMLAFWGWIAPETSGVGRISLVFVVICVLHSLLLAINLIDLPTPVLSAGANGIVLSGKITRHDLFHWDEVKTFKVIDLHWPVYVPLFSYLVIRTGKPAHFSGLSRLSPLAWFGVYAIPTRMVRGGAKAARQMVGTIRNITEAQRHDATGGTREFMSDTSLAWAMLRNTEFPVGKDGPSEAAIVAATRDSLMEEAGLHRDLLPDEYRDQILASESGAALAAKGEQWGREVAAGMIPRKPAPVGLAGLTPAAAPKPAGFGRKGVLLNGQPID